MPIQNGKYKSPHWVDNSPPAIDAAELNAISDTLENLDAGGGTGGGDGKRYARFVIGTSTNGWTAEDCDYLCDGVDDQVEINQAIEAIQKTPNYNAYYRSGTIVILDGRYHLSGPLSPILGMVLQGTGGTNLIRETESGGQYRNYIIAGQNATISNIFYEGNAENLSGMESETYDIYLNGGSIIDNCSIQNYTHGGIFVLAQNDTVEIRNSEISSIFSSSNVGIHCEKSYVLRLLGNRLSSNANVEVVGSASYYTCCMFVNNSAPYNAIAPDYSLDMCAGSYICNNDFRIIQILNTGNFSLSTSNIVIGNHAQNGYITDLIVLGENTSRNIVALNNLFYNNVLCTIQDNGTNNLVINNIAGT